MLGLLILSVLTWWTYSQNSNSSDEFGAQTSNPSQEVTNAGSTPEEHRVPDKPQEEHAPSLKAEEPDGVATKSQQGPAIVHSAPSVRESKESKALRRTKQIELVESLIKRVDDKLGALPEGGERKELLEHRRKLGVRRNLLQAQLKESTEPIKL